eukprot:1161231-Pelagomonas_calceolata.AAC.2
MAGHRHKKTQARAHTHTHAYLRTMHVYALAGTCNSSLVGISTIAHACWLQFCHKYTLERLQNLPEVAGCEAKLRMDGDKPYVTDNSNFIVDLYFQVWVRCQRGSSWHVSSLVHGKEKLRMP